MDGSGSSAGRSLHTNHRRSPRLLFPLASVLSFHCRRLGSTGARVPKFQSQPARSGLGLCTTPQGGDRVEGPQATRCVTDLDPAGAPGLLRWKRYQEINTVVTPALLIVSQRRPNLSWRQGPLFAT